MDLAIDYSKDPNPHEEIWTHTHVMSSSSSFGSSLRPLSTSNPALNCPRPFVPHLSPSVDFKDVSGLDCPLLSPATLNLINTCLHPSPTFDSSLAHTPHIFIPSCTPSFSSIAQPESSTLQFPTQVEIPVPNPNGSTPSTPIHSGCFSTLVPNPKSTPSTLKKVNQGIRGLLWD